MRTPTYTAASCIAAAVRIDRARRGGHTLVEAVFAVVVLAIIIGIVAVNLPGIVQSAKFDRDVGQFSRTLRLAAEQAIFRNERLAIVIDVYDGYYTVYEANEDDVYNEQVEPFIERQGLDFCYIDDIEFEDGSHQYSGELILYATPQGFAAPILMTLIDLEEQYRFLSCRRLTTHVQVSKQPLELPEAKAELSMASGV